MNSLADLQMLLEQRQIPAATPEFLSSVRNPNVANNRPGKQPQFVHPAFRAIGNMPGQAVSLLQSLGGGNSPVTPTPIAPGGGNSLLDFFSMVQGYDSKTKAAIEAQSR